MEGDQVGQKFHFLVVSNEKSLKLTQFMAMTSLFI